MNAFERFHELDGSEPKYTVAEATCGVLLAVIACDGNVAMDEMAYFDLVTSHHVLFRESSVAQINRMVDDLALTLHRDGWKSLAEKCAKQIPEETKLTVLSLAVDFIFADGIVTQQEEEIVYQLQRLFDISESQLAPIIEVLAIKNGL